jgi:hypothetical protein
MSDLTGRLLSDGIGNDKSSTHHEEIMTLMLEENDYASVARICDPLVYANPSPPSTGFASTLPANVESTLKQLRYERDLVAQAIVSLQRVQGRRSRRGRSTR